MLKLPFLKKKKSRRALHPATSDRGNGMYQQGFWFVTGALTVIVVLNVQTKLPMVQGIQSNGKQAALQAAAQAPSESDISALPPPAHPHLDTPSPANAAKIMMKKESWNLLLHNWGADQPKWKTFYTSPHHAQFGKALDSRKWTPVDRDLDAEIIWLQKKKDMPWNKIKPWQRVNHFRDETNVAHKGKMLEHLRKTKSEALKYLPESFALWLEDDRKGLKAAIESDLKANRDEWWVLKEPGRDGGKGVKFAKDAAKLLGEIDQHRDEIAQRYVDNPMLLDGKKFDLRVYWAVVTSRYEPLVLYHPGSLRVSITPYNASGGPVGQLLTNAAQQGKGGHSKDIDEESRQPLSALWSLLEHHPRRAQWGVKDARTFLECEMRRAITSVFQAFQHTVFVSGDAADTFSLLGADFMLDSDLHMYLSEMQSGPGLPHNTKAVKDVMDVMIPGLADIVLHVRDAHMRGSTEVPFPLPHTNFDVIVNGSTRVLPPFCDPPR